eukprot:1281124-Amorphochlora_amoeboformis.AAC.1
MDSHDTCLFSLHRHERTRPLNYFKSSQTPYHSEGDSSRTCPHNTGVQGIHGIRGFRYPCCKARVMLRDQAHGNARGKWVVLRVFALFASFAYLTNPRDTDPLERILGNNPTTGDNLKSRREHLVINHQSQHYILNFLQQKVCVLYGSVMGAAERLAEILAGRINALHHGERMGSRLKAAAMDLSVSRASDIHI